MMAAVYDATGGRPLTLLADLGVVDSNPIIYDQRVRVDEGGTWVVRRVTDTVSLLGVVTFTGGALESYLGWGDSVAYRPVDNARKPPSTG